MGWQEERQAIHDKIDALLSDLRLSMIATFVPWSQSRHRHEQDRSLNWKIVIKQGDRVILDDVDYSAGIGHCPAYQDKTLGVGHRMTIDREAAIIHETERGTAYQATKLHLQQYQRGGPIQPDIKDVLSALVSEAIVIDYRSFEEWAPDLGIDPDSRKGEQMYRECLRIALTLRNGLGDADFRRLCDVFQDY